MKFNWDQSGMPVSLVSRMGLRSEFSEYKSVLRDVQDQVMIPVDAEALAKELVQSGGRAFVDIVRELTTTLASTRKELASANRRCERLSAELARHGIGLAAEAPPPAAPGDPAPPSAGPVVDAAAEWEEWDRRFQALLG